MTDTASPPPTDTTPVDDVFARLRASTLVRDPDRRWFGGVCAGIARRYDVDPLLIRAAAIALTIAAGVGVLVYLVLWLLLPDPRGSVPVEQALRKGDAGAITLLVFTLLGSAIGVALVTSGQSDLFGAFWVLVPAGLVVWLVASRAGRSTAVATTPGPATAATTATDPRTRGDAPQNPQRVTTRVEEMGAGQPPYGPRPTQPLGPPPPPKPRRRRPGGAVALIGLGTAILLGGLGVLIADPVGFPGSPGQLGVVLALAGVSALVLGLGVTGRASGFSGFLVVVLLVASLATTVAVHTVAEDGVGERVWQPTSTSLPATYRLSAGNADLDLGGLTALPPGGSPASVDARLGLGELRVSVPDGLTARVETSIRGGELRVRSTTGAERVRSGSDIVDTVVVGDGEPQVVVHLDVELGTVVITEED